MLHAMANEAKSERATGHGRAPAAALAEPAIAPPVAGNQALLRASATPRVRPSRMPLLQRQCACGRTCPSCKDEAAGLQTKLAISEPGDEYEQEADRVADQVMRMPATAVQRTVETVPLQRRARDTAIPDGVPPIVGEVLRSPGQPLDAGTRAFMEPRFGQELGAVRVHTDSKAAESARAVNALAYTVGSDIAFAAGRYAPAGQTGRHLLAHELTHALQQGTQLRRKVKVQPPGEAGDILGQFNFICPSGGFTAASGEIAGHCDKSVNSGCDCLCDVAADPARLYTIKVAPAKASTEVVGLANQTSAAVPKTSVFPDTILGPNPLVNMPASTGSDVEFGAFRPDGTADWAENWRILGHELCGHARLGQTYAGGFGNRPDHNATIDTENAIAAEHGGDARGHFTNPRQGESFLNPVGDRSKVRFSLTDGVHYEAP
jgi:uncharacterized protein DUF4157